MQTNMKRMSWWDLEIQNLPWCSSHILFYRHAGKGGQIFAEPPRAFHRRQEMSIWFNQDFKPLKLFGCGMVTQPLTSLGGLVGVSGLSACPVETRAHMRPSWIVHRYPFVEVIFDSGRARGWSICRKTRSNIWVTPSTLDLPRQYTYKCRF